MNWDDFLKYAPVITALISIINILTTICLATVNIFFSWRKDIREKKREVIRTYYLPLLIELTSTSNKISMEKSSSSLGNIYEFDQGADPAKKTSRNNIVDLYYRSFIEFYDKLPKYYYNIEVDNLIFRTYVHMKVIVCSFGDEANIPDYLTKYNTTYPEPNYKDVLESLKKITSDYSWWNKLTNYCRKKRKIV